MKNKSFNAVFGAACISAVAVSTSGQTINSGDASLNIVPIPFSSNLPNGALKLDGATSSDQLSQHCWYYRTQNNNQNSFFSLLDTPVTVVSGDRMTQTYTNTGPGAVGNERFNATIETILQDGTIPNSGRVFSKLTVQAAPTNLAPRTYNFFLIEDIDLAGGIPNPGPDDSITYDEVQNRAGFVEVSSTNFAEAVAENPTHFEINTGAALRSRMSGGAGNFTDSAAPRTGDVAVGYQWTLTLNPGQTAVLRAGLSVNLMAQYVSCVADFNLDGTLDFFDYLDFVEAFSAFSTAADFNGDNAIDLFDYLDFVGAFSSGC